MKTKLEAIGEIYGIRPMENEDEERFRERVRNFTKAAPTTKASIINELSMRHRGSFEIIEHVTHTRRLTRWELVKAFFLGRRFVYPRPERLLSCFAVLMNATHVDDIEIVEVMSTLNQFRPVGVLVQLWVNGKRAA